MRTSQWMLSMVLCAAGAVAFAKLPAPTPEQEQAAAMKKEQEKAQLEKEKQQLERAQDRIADYYRKTKGAAAQRAGRTEDTNMPKTTRELPRQAGPQGGREQSAEAHSTPAK